ncbi:cytochrome P450 [Mycobacterium sp. M23085]|uniref:cytochrome P450 n=1 Tax=Mycobacterium sp. M23085 TaxID=3378087 RepID=UPI003877CA84
MTVSQLLFDPFSDDFFAGPYETYRRMRDEAPVYYSDEYDFYALTRHADVAAAFKDHAMYSSARGVDLSMVRAMIEAGTTPEPKMIIYMDPPDHRQMRSLVNKVFTPRAISELEAMVGAQIERHLPSAADTFDAVQDFSALFPVEVIACMMGVDVGHAQQLRHWIDRSLHRNPGQIDMDDDGIQAGNEMGLWCYELVQQRRAKPRDDMISRLIAAEINDENGRLRSLDDIEITGFAALLGGAGAETVTKLVGNAVVMFAQHPEQWHQLREDRSKIPFAVEELLRYEAPAQYNVRCSTRDVTLHGITIPADKPVFLVGGSANRDPRAWSDPDRFDINRNPIQAQNLGFGYGIHSCLGAALARMESAIAIDRLLDVMPHYDVDWDNCSRVSMQNVSGWQNIPVRVRR